MYDFDFYFKVIFGSYTLLGLTFSLTNLILDDKFIRIKEDITNLFDTIIYNIVIIFLFPMFFFKNTLSEDESILDLNDENKELKHREFLSIWLNLILICIIYILLKLYVI